MRDRGSLNALRLDLISLYPSSSGNQKQIGLVGWKTEKLEEKKNWLKNEYGIHETMDEKVMCTEE